MKQKHIHLLLIILATAGAVVAGAGVNAARQPVGYDLTEHGAELTITNTTSAPIVFETALIAYATGATNTVTFSLISGGETYQIGTAASTNAAAATKIWSAPVRIPVYPSEVFKIASTETNATIYIIQEAH